MGFYFKLVDCFMHFYRYDIFYHCFYVYDILLLAVLSEQLAFGMAGCKSSEINK